MSQEETITNEEQQQPENPSASAEPIREPAQDETLAKLQHQAQEYLEGWQRERAEFSNYRRRVENQLKESHQSASVELLTRLIPIIDDFERALGNVPPELQGQPWLNGVTLIYRKFQKMLDDHGVVAVDPVGQTFDPNRHEAVGMDEAADGQSGSVTATLQKGYLFGDRVLRPALVRVAR